MPFGKNVSSVASINKLFSVPRRTVYHATNRCKKLGTFYNRPKCGRPRSADTPVIRNKIRNGILRNPQYSHRKLAKDFKISTWSVRNIVKNKLQFSPIT